MPSGGAHQFDAGGQPFAQFSRFQKNGLGTLPETCSKPLEEIQHSQDLKIESANKF
jgi:hypothetical protein